jgi:hypothetical protein
MQFIWKGRDETGMVHIFAEGVTAWIRTEALDSHGSVRYLK